MSLSAVLVCVNLTWSEGEQENHRYAERRDVHGGTEERNTGAGGRVSHDSVSPDKLTVFPS